MTNLISIAQHFQLEAEIKDIKPLGEGFINDTFIITTTNNGPRYILQRKNKNIFSPIPSMMENIQKVCSHIKTKVVAAGGDPLREAMTIIPTKDEKLYFLDDEEEFWAVCLFIEDTIAYEAAETPELAYAGGKGIGKFQSLVADLKEPLVNILPGFHDIAYRYKQWDEVLAKDPVGRKELVGEEISWIESRKAEMLAFWELVENGEIPTRISHNDTKINNILFDKKGEVLCVIDLDTVLSSTVLNDFGDAMRFYTNTGLEDDTNLDNVSMDMEIFKAFAKGYLEETASFLSPKEIEYLAFSARYITYEQVLRFLMDYIDGDNYYKTKSEDHNLVRTRAQYKLLQSMEEQFSEMEDFVKSCVTELKN
ncbi:aminoglycoside phosphotransferase family protein [Draconibacterium sp. IB214405]|uniref:phosphotransferase enzyme family protein n=1 Tax=Draconibacterium sp. IB214405 TaxID=3097352 RepID=UPI002A0E60A5|nr:aminoglycoside phosphotransferase family protein [Draconibacterium sp. IB214405]MDX8339215.1 aminoglycoside phosphotransferase family protein [Draconibacterium sp. IB214405]